MRQVFDFGAANTGQTPTFLVYKDISTRADLVQPIFYEIGNGRYYADITFPLPDSPDTTTIAFKATCNGVSPSGTISTDQPVGINPLIYLLDFGTIWAGNTPSFAAPYGGFQDVLTLASITPPAIAEVGFGLYTFPYQFPIASSPGTLSVTFAVNVGGLTGVTLTDVISSLGSTVYPGAVTLAQLQEQVRQRADMQNSQFVTDDEITGYINSSAKELYGLLVQKYGEDYFIAPPFQIVTDGVSDTFPLPNDFFKGKGVDLQVTPGATSEQGNWVTLRPFEFAERNRLGILGVPAGPGARRPQYRYRGNNLWLSPLPTASLTLRVFYVPRFVSLVLGTDLLDGVSGWEEYVVVDAAMKCLVKEESDITALAAAKAALVARIEAEAANRDEGSPGRVSDVYATGMGGEFPGDSEPYGWP